MLAQPYQLYIERIDATKNMARFYALSIDATLFGTPCLTRRWGRIGTQGQTLLQHFDREDAVRQFLNLPNSKRVQDYGTKPAKRSGALP